MNKNKMMIDMLAELSMIVASADKAVDWGDLAVREEDAYKMMASHVVELVSQHPMDSDKLITLMAVATHLMVENFVLHMHLEMLRHQLFH